MSGLARVKRSVRLSQIVGKADKRTYLIGVDKPLNCGILKRLVAVWDVNSVSAKWLESAI